MILLEAGNKIIQSILKSRIDFLLAEHTKQKKLSNNDQNSPLPSLDPVDTFLSDFDEVSYHVFSVPSSKLPENSLKNSVLCIEMIMPCFSSELVNYGAKDILEQEYSQMTLDGQKLFRIKYPDYATNGGSADKTRFSKKPNVALEVNLSQFYFNAENPKISMIAEKFIGKASLLKAFSMSAPFQRAFDQQLSGASDCPLMKVSYRDKECIYIKASQDRVTVIFSVSFKDETDKTFGKVFLQEFVDCRKLPGLQNAPQVLFTHKEPPSDIQGLIPNLPTEKEDKSGDDLNYITMILNPRHYKPDASSGKDVTESRALQITHLIHLFRDYLHYHIKCSKAYMHSRMRMRVNNWTKVLNRAKPEVDAIWGSTTGERKTASGKTFVRK